MTAGEQPPLIEDEAPDVEIVGARFAQIPEWVLYHPNLTATAVRLYGALVRHGETPGSCYPSYRRLGELIHVSERSVKRPLDELVEARAVQVVTRYDRSGRQTSNGYRVTVGAPFPRRAPERGTHAQERGGTHALERGGDPRARTRLTRARDEREQEERDGVAADASTRPRDPIRAMVDAWWLEHTPRPQQPYIAIVKVLTAAHKAGWTLDDLDAALHEIPVVTGGALDVWRRNRTRSSPAGAAAAARPRIDPKLIARMGGDPT